MGRGLSELQRTMLSTAYENGDSVAGYAEILAAHYGWQACYKAKYRGVKSTIDRRGNNFSLAAVGEHKYRSAMAAVSRSTARLIERGLIEGSTRTASAGGRVRLTDEGRREAERIAKG